MKVSPSGGFLAYTLQLGPGEACCARVRDLACGTFLAAGELESAVSLDWADEGATLLYTLPDELGRPHKVRSLLTGCSCTAGLIMFFHAWPGFTQILMSVNMT